MSENKADPLLPCPFCGGKASRLAFNLVCCCDNLDCAGGLRRMPIAKWNTRAAPQPAAPLGGRHPIEILWRDHDLPEWFLGNGGTNTKLYALYDAILAIPQERGVDRAAIIKECETCVPTNWLDPLLTGPNKVGDLPARETEALLRSIRDRIRDLGKETGR